MSPTLYPLQRSTFGGGVERIGTVSRGKVSVSTSSTQILSSNSARRFLLLVNYGSNDCFIRFGATATTDDLPLSANGGSLLLDRIVPTTTVNGITSSDSTDVRYIEM